MRRFEGGYYFAIIELLKKLDKGEYTMKQLFYSFEEMFGSGNLINFRKAVKQLKKSGIVEARKGEQNKQYYHLIKTREKDFSISNI